MRLRPYLVLTVTLTVVLASGSVRADGPRLYLPDICIEPGATSFITPLYLVGSDERPASLRTTLLFDPASLELLEARGEPAVRRGAGLLGTRTEFSFEFLPEVGELSIVLNSAGRVPVAPLPAGALAEIHFRLKPPATRREALRIEFDPGRTRSLDSSGREMFTLTDVPAFVWIGQTRLQVEVGTPAEDGSTAVRAWGVMSERAALLMRGQSSQLLRDAEAVTFQEMVSMGSAASGRPLQDTDRPLEGETYYYMAAHQDGSRVAMLGFGSACRSRHARVEVTEKD